MVVYNRTQKPILIMCGIVVDPNGGHASGETEICIMPDQGIELDIIGLKAEKLNDASLEKRGICGPTKDCPEDERDLATKR